MLWLTIFHAEGRVLVIVLISSAVYRVYCFVAIK